MKKPQGAPLNTIPDTQQPEPKKNKKLKFETDTERLASQHAFDHVSGERDDANRQYIKIKETLATRDEFLAIVSHDLRSPLGVIAMSADQLTKLAEQEKGSSLQLKLIKMIQRNALVMERLISDLLDIERMSGNRLLLTLTHCDINTICRNAVELFRPIALVKSIDLNLKLSSESLKALCDENRIQQVLSNLLSNAIKFTPSGGSIVIENHSNGSDVEFSVRDSGPGVPEDKMVTIFQRSSQLKEKDHRGLGLGLYISKWLVEAHQGPIGVENFPGEGSRFFFRIPMLDS